MSTRKVTLWLQRDGRIIAGPTEAFGTDDLVPPAGMDATWATVLELPNLTAFPLPEYLSADVNPTTYRQHMQALFATSGPAYRLHLLADAIFEYASECGPEGKDNWVGSGLVKDLLEVFVSLLNDDRGGFDGGHLSSWATFIADFIDRPFEQ